MKSKLMLGYSKDKTKEGDEEKEFYTLVSFDKEFKGEYIFGKGFAVLQIANIKNLVKKEKVFGKKTNSS
jgi:hypothetical protein